LPLFVPFPLDIRHTCNYSLLEEILEHTPGPHWIRHGKICQYSTLDPTSVESDKLLFIFALVYLPLMFFFSVEGIAGIAPGPLGCASCKISDCG